MRIHCRTLVFIAAVPLFMLGSSCAERRSARDEIGATYQTMEKAFHDGNVELIAASYTDDAEWFAPEGRVIKGRSAIGRAWRENGGSGGNRLRFDVAEFDQDGSRADEVGRFTISGPDGDVITAGKYLVVWARQPDGQWKARRGMFNWDIPPRRPESEEMR